MPRNGQAGFSDNTPVKQEHFSKIMQTLCKVVKGIMRRHGAAVYPHFVYIDLNAGAGWYPRSTLFGSGYPGSPLIAIETAHQVGIPLLAYCMEQDHPTAKSLYEQLTTSGLSSLRDPSIPPVVLVGKGIECVVTLWPWDSALALADVVQELQEAQQAHHSARVHGVVYSDVNGGNIPIEELHTYSLALPYVDVIIHYSPTHRKRVHGRYGTRPPIEDEIRRIDKGYWVVRKPARREQWTFLIGTNWHAFPAFTKQGFVDLYSPEGRAIMKTISYRREEEA